MSSAGHRICSSTNGMLVAFLTKPVPTAKQHTGQSPTSSTPPVVTAKETIGGVAGGWLCEKVRTESRAKQRGN